MALTDTFVKQVKPKGSATGEKYADGGGLYLLVKVSGKYWRLDYRFADKRKTLALGVYPEVTLAKARLKRAKAREQLADGIDPGLAKKAEKQISNLAAANTFEEVAREYLQTKAHDWTPAYAEKW